MELAIGTLETIVSETESGPVRLYLLVILAGLFLFHLPLSYFWASKWLQYFILTRNHSFVPWTVFYALRRDSLAYHVCKTDSRQETDVL